jgi:hypothetical protein
MNRTAIKIFPYAIIAILVYILLHLKGCFGESDQQKKNISIGGKDYEVIKEERDTFYKTDTQIFYRRAGEIPHDIDPPVEIPADIDTQLILKDYYSRVFYRDTISLNDSLGYFIILDTITENRILSRKFESRVNIPTIKETIYLKEINRDFYIGPSVQVGRMPSIGADFHIKTKKDVLIGLGLGINLEASPYARGSISWKINK